MLEVEPRSGNLRVLVLRGDKQKLCCTLPAHFNCHPHLPPGREGPPWLPGKVGSCISGLFSGAWPAQHSLRQLSVLPVLDVFPGKLFTR